MSVVCLKNSSELGLWRLRNERTNEWKRWKSRFFSLAISSHFYFLLISASDHAGHQIECHFCYFIQVLLHWYVMSILSFTFCFQNISTTSTTIYKKKKKNNLWKCATLTLLATIVTISISPIYAYIYKKKRQFSKRNGVKVGRFFLVKSAPRTECKQSSRRGRPKLWTWIFTCANFLTPRRASHSNSQTQDGNKNYMNTFNLRLSLATIARMIILKKKKKKT